MSTNATREDIDEILSQLDDMAKIMISRFDVVEKSIETKASKDDIQKIMSFLDSIAKRQEINDDERLVMGYQLERLDRWTHELADKIGYKLAT
jgi:arsenate reductase-like glutaredoxin family protein